MHGNTPHSPHMPNAPAPVMGAPTPSRIMPVRRNSTVRGRAPSAPTIPDRGTATVPAAKYNAAWNGWTRLFGPLDHGRFRKATKTLLSMETLGAFLRAAQAYKDESQPGRATSLEWFVSAFQQWLEEANKSPADVWPGYAKAAGIVDAAAFSLHYRGRLLEQDAEMEKQFDAPVPDTLAPQPSLFHDPNV